MSITPILDEPDWYDLKNTEWTFVGEYEITKGKVIELSNSMEGGITELCEMVVRNDVTEEVAYYRYAIIHWFYGSYDTRVEWRTKEQIEFRVDE